MLLDLIKRSKGIILLVMEWISGSQERKMHFLLELFRVL